MLIIKPIDSQSVWENFLLNSNQVNFLQSWNWGEFHHSLAKKIFRLGFYQADQLQGLALLIKIKAKRGTYLECPGGPVINWDKPSALAAFVNQVKTLAVQEKANFLRIRPNILNSAENKQKLKSQGFIKAPMHLHAETTWVLDLDKSEEDLLSQMRKNTRYSIKKAQKLGVKVETSTSDKDIDLLYQLQMAAVKRHKFTPFSKEYFSKQLQTFKNHNQIQLFKASYQGQVLAISFIIFYGQEAVYHYSGSSNQLRHIPASYLLQWQAIKAAKKRGLKRYNFWGITKDDNPKHRFAGVTLFKKGFGGYQLDYLPAYDLPLKPVYWLTYLFETLRRKSRHL